MRLVVCSTGIPHRDFSPKLSASLMLLHSYVTEMKRAGVEILHLLILDRKSFDEGLLRRYRAEQEDAQFSIVVWQPPAYIQSRRSVLAPIHPRLLPPDVREKVEAFRPDAFFCLDAYSAGCLKGVRSAPILVQVHDPKFQTLWYHALYALQENPLHPVQPVVDILQSLRWRSYYKEALTHTETVITVASSGADALTRMGIPSRVFPMLWIGVPGADTSIPETLPEIPTFVFQGNLAGLGSRAALHFLLEKTFPLMRKEFGAGRFSLLFCGSRTLPEWVARRISALPEIRFLGFVEDIASLLRGCHAVLAPIDVPVGNRTRILTAMALGVPAITHSRIASANPHLIHNETCLIADTPALFVEHMVHAYRRGPEVLRIIRAAQRVYRETFSPPAATHALLQEITAMIARKRMPALSRQ